MDVKQTAKIYKRKIREYYAAVSPAVPMKLSFVRAVGDLFVFLIKFVPGTTESKLRKNLGDIQQTLGLRLFQLHREDMDFFFVVSKHNTFDNRLLGILTSPSYPEHIKDMAIPYPIGFDVMRKPIIADLVLYFSWLLGGASGSGKTTGIRSLVASILWSCSPKNVNLIIIDPAANLTQFGEFPHLSCPVIYDPKAGRKAISHLCTEMNRRLILKGENPDEFNLLPMVVCVIDECVSFVSGIGNKQASQSLAGIISNILRMGRHARIFLVLATQNPSLDEMKCDLSPITSRISYKVGKSQGSVTILGEGGAKALLGQGEMYFISQHHSGLMYLKGAYITEEEIETVCCHVRKKYEETELDDRYTFTIDAADLQPSDDDDMRGDSFAIAEQDDEDKLFAEIIMWTLRRETVSGNLIGKTFEVGARKASKLLDRLHKSGLAGDANVKCGRKVLPVCIEDLTKETISLLNRHGYKADDIEATFAIKYVVPDMSEGEGAMDDEKRGVL
jgi:S-DNA-T family DNA segregation ATPase FtsK/SpoIIIE